MHQTAHSKNNNTPGRHRSLPNKTPQKTYASENDVPSRGHGYYDSPATPQQIPGGHPSLQHAQSTNSKQRNRHSYKGQGRAKNGTASPGFNKHDRRSAVYSMEQAPADPAFAGATFHNSPAPSSLPPPSFLARMTSAPDSPSVKQAAPSPGRDQSPATTDSEETIATTPPTVSRNEESPLEFFFKADRAEKARAHRASSANAAGIATGPFSPPAESPQECNTFPRSQVNALFSSRRPNIAQHNSSSGICVAELDGTPGQPLGPAFSTPYQERMRAARSSTNSAQATPTARQDANFNKSEALKRYLFTGNTESSPKPQQQARPPRESPPKMPRGMIPTSVLTNNIRTPRVGPNPHEYSPSRELDADQVRSMEESLRRVLNLNTPA